MPGPEERTLRIEDCRSEADIQRLDPRVYADLVSRPASMLDLLKLQLGVAEAMRTISKAMGGQ